MKFKNFIGSVYFILSLICLTLFSVGQINVVSAGGTHIDLSDQQEKYGNKWNDAKLKSWPASQCQGFAIMMKHKTSGGTEPEDWEIICSLDSIYDLQAGDIVRYTLKSNSTTSLHSIFITETDDDGTIKFADANYDNKNGIRWSVKMSDALKKRIFESINNEGTSKYPTYVWR